MPFSWVDAGAREKDSCYLSEDLRSPLTEIYENQLTASLAFFQMDRFQADNAIDGLWYGNWTNAEGFKSVVVLGRQSLTEFLENVSNRSPLEEERLALYRQKLIRIAAQTGQQVAADEASGLRRMVVFVDQRIQWAKQHRYGSVAVANLEQRKQFILQRITELDAIAQSWRIR